jgi:DNA-binding beta-propeller fold protein YncE
MIHTASKRVVGPPVTVGNKVVAVVIAPNGKYAYAINAVDPTGGSAGTVSVIDITPSHPE